MEKESDIAYVRWFSELSNKDVSIGGGKGASLAEMYNAKFPIPPGFILTAQAYAFFIEHAQLGPAIQEIIDSIAMEDTHALQAASQKIRALIEEAAFPKAMEEAIVEAYSMLDVDRNYGEHMRKEALAILQKSHEPPFVAVRSSATTEDLVDASFAGQQESFLNVKGEKDLLAAVKKCYSSLFTARAIYYRAKKGFSHTKAYLATVVQKMVDSDKSGVMFSKNPVSPEKNIVIEAVFG